MYNYCVSLYLAHYNLCKERSLMVKKVGQSKLNFNRKRTREQGQQAKEVDSDLDDSDRESQ